MFILRNKNYNLWFIQSSIAFRDLRGLDTKPIGLNFSAYST